MKKTYLLAVALLAAGMAVGEAYAQNVVVRNKDGSESIRLLSSLQKISFEDGALALSFTSGSTETFSISTIEKLYFGTGTNSAGITLSEADEISVYPNPAGSYLVLRDIPESVTFVTVYRTDGAAVFQEQVSPGTQTLTLVQLPKGLYILKAGGQAIKFIKQ